MEHRGPFAGPGGLASGRGLLDLPEELLLQILRKLEDACVKKGETSAEFLQLRTVCKRLQRAVDASITSLSRGIARKFCRREPLLQAKGELQRQLARWGRLRRVELHVRGSNCALSQLIPALGESCPGLTALCIAKIDLVPEQPRVCRSIAHLTSLSSLESLSLTGFCSFTATLPPLPSLRTLEADFDTLACPSPLPALEELDFGLSPSGDRSEGEAWSLEIPHLHTSSPLRRLSLAWVSMLQLQLPKSLRVLDLEYVELDVPLDVGKDLPELAELQVILDSSTSSPVKLDGLSTLLSLGHLRKLTVQDREKQLVKTFFVPKALALATGLTSLSLLSVNVTCVPELLVAATALTKLELKDLQGFDYRDKIDLSCLNLQHLQLEKLEETNSIEGLGLQTRLTSLALAQLPCLFDLPDLRTFTRLTSLELVKLPLRNWSPDCCSLLPDLKRLQLSKVGPVIHKIWSPGIPATFLLELGTLTTLTKLDLKRFAGPAIDLASIPLIETLRLCDCPELSDLSGIHSLPRLHSLKLLDPMPKLRTLNIASCPHLTTASFDVSHLWHLAMEDLPLLERVTYLPLSLLTVHVASCGSLKTLRVKDLPSLASLQLTGVPQLHLQRVQLRNTSELKSVKLDGLTRLSCLIISNCSTLEAVYVAGSPLTELVLKNLPKLTAPNLRINDFYLHGSDSAPSSPPLPPPVASQPAPPGPPPVHPPSLSFQNLQGLRSLTLSRLPGPLTLDQLPLQTGLTSLRLERLHVSRLPKELVSLTALSTLFLGDVRVDHADPLPPDSWPLLGELVLSGVTDLLHWAGLNMGLSWSAPPAQVHGGHVGREAGPFWSLTKLDLVGLGVASLDVSQLASVRELAVLRCPSLTRLAGITNLLHLTSVRLVDIPQLQELAIVSCPKLVSVVREHVQPVHLHLEDLPSLPTTTFCFHDRDDLVCPHHHNCCFPGYDAGLQSLKLRNLPSLSRVVVSGLMDLESLVVTRCFALEEVELAMLECLTSLKLDEFAEDCSGEACSSASGPTPPSQGIGYLYLHDLPMLKSVPCPPTLRNMEVRSCPALTSLPLSHVSSLEELELQDVAEEALPMWLKQVPSLKKLEFGRSA